MFIYKGRIYRKQDWFENGICKNCDLFKYKTPGRCVTTACEGYSNMKEIFISRLFHAIIEVFYGAAKW